VTFLQEIERRLVEIVHLRYLLAAFPYAAVRQRTELILSHARNQMQLRTQNVDDQ
jgi:hypothetical protein